MSDNFDDLADDFINEGDKNHYKSRKNIFPLNMGDEETTPNILFDINNLPDDLSPEIRGIIEALSEIKSRSGDIQKELNLGEPDEQETIEEDGNTIDKSTWETDFGSVTRITIGSITPSDFNSEEIRNLFRSSVDIPLKDKELTLEEKLRIAEKNEDYMECAKIKAEIDKKNKKSENSENVSTEGDSEGNFWDDI